jgi:hypothetical protein
MWCPRCKQDVPAQAQHSSGALHCGACAAVLSEGASPTEPPPGLPGSDSPARVPDCHDAISPASLLSDWRLDQDLEDVRQLIRRTAHRLEAIVRPDDSFSLADCVEPSSSALSEVGKSPERQKPSAAGDWTTAGGWLLVCLGATGLVFASVLFTATMLGSKHGEPVWPLCLLSAFAGQFLVVIGLLVRHNDRRQRALEPAKATSPDTARQPSTPIKVRVPPSHSRPPWSETVEQALAANLESRG